MHETGDGNKYREFSILRLIAFAPLLFAATPVLAEAAQPASEDRDDGAIVPTGSEIVVLATRMRGEVDGAQPPVMTLDETEIASYGAASLGELVAAISPQTGSGRGRGQGHPVMLVNGQRVSSFREMRNIPPEAIRKVEVLPEEVSLRFGYPPNQRVINFILKENFATVSVAGEYNIPSRGGFTNSEIEAGLVRIDGPRRLNIEAKAVDDTMLTEAERGVIQSAASRPTVAGDPDPAQFRSLVDDSRELTLNGTWSAGLGDQGMEGSLSLNAAMTQNDSRALLGLDTVRLSGPTGETSVRTLADPLERVTDARTYQAGATLNRRLGDWQLTATVDGSYVDTVTRIDRARDTTVLVEAAAAGLLPVDGALPALPGGGFDRTRARDLSASSLLTLAGSPLMLPAGEVSLTVRGGFDYERTRNFTTRSANPAATLKRGDLSGGFNVALPLTSRREGVLDAIGDVTLNFSAGINDLSDFGTLTNWNAGISWNLTEKLGLQASYIVNEAAPSLADLGSPELALANVPVFDFTNGETALVTIVTGGNPNLVKEKQRDLKLSANWELPFMERSNLIVEYFRNSSDDVTRAYPLLTPAIEAAFPGRTTRDENNRLLRIDRRPVTYDRVASSRIRWGFNLSGRLSSDGEAGSGDRSERGGAPGMAPTVREPASGLVGFDPARFAELRGSLCGGGASPDVATLPEDLQARLRGPDGTVDPERFARFRERLCASPGEGGGPDFERFARLRQQLCGAETPDPATLPDRMRERLLAADGSIDPARLAALRERMCSPGTPDAAASPAPASAAAARTAGGPRGPMGFGRGGPPGGRWNLSIYHTWRFDETVRIAPGGPLLDLLAGDALTVGGVARHSLEFEGGVFKDGMGLRLNGSWMAPVRVRASGAPGSADLRFGSVFSIDARAFINLGQQQKLVAKYPFLKGVRIALTADNLLDSRQKVTDPSGITPIAYQKDLRDPRGRVIGIDIRKMF